jgi:hypothetical protein
MKGFVTTSAYAAIAAFHAPVEIVKRALWGSKLEDYNLQKKTTASCRMCVTTEYGNDGIHEYVLTMYASSIEN